MSTHVIYLYPYDIGFRYEAGVTCTKFVDYVKSLFRAADVVFASIHLCDNGGNIIEEKKGDERVDSETMDLVVFGVNRNYWCSEHDKSVPAKLLEPLKRLRAIANTEVCI